MCRQELSCSCPPAVDGLSVQDTCSSCEVARWLLQPAGEECSFSQVFARVSKKPLLRLAQSSARLPWKRFSKLDPSTISPRCMLC